jgi:hypothetical protein
LVFLHALVPHDPFHYLADGATYRGSHPTTGVEDDRWVTGSAAAVGRQRHLLQTEAADALLGRLLDRLRATGTYDDALIVVTADHGIAFSPGEPVRGISDAQYEQVLWTPLVVKAPGQARGQVVDTPTRSLDVMPTVADILGVDVPGELDGVAARHRAAASRAQPVVQDWPGNHLTDPGPDDLVAIDGEQGWKRLVGGRALPAPGTDAVWQAVPDLPLVGHRIDSLTTAQPGLPSAQPLRLAVEGLDDLERVDLDRPLPLELVGKLTGYGHRTIAVALDGTIAAIVQTDAPASTEVVALLKADTLHSGSNQLEALQLDDNGAVIGPVSVTPS